MSTYQFNDSTAQVIQIIRLQFCTMIHSIRFLRQLDDVLSKRFKTKIRRYIKGELPPPLRSLSRKQTIQRNVGAKASVVQLALWRCFPDFAGKARLIYLLYDGAIVVAVGH